MVHLNQGDKPRISDVPGAATVSAKPVPGATPPPEGWNSRAGPANNLHSAATPTPPRSGSNESSYANAKRF